MNFDPRIKFFFSNFACICTHHFIGRLFINFVWFPKFPHAYQMWMKTARQITILKSLFKLDNHFLKHTIGCGLVVGIFTVCLLPFGEKNQANISTVDLQFRRMLTGIQTIWIISNAIIVGSMNSHEYDQHSLQFNGGKITTVCCKVYRKTYLNFPFEMHPNSDFRNLFSQLQRFKKQIPSNVK